MKIRSKLPDDHVWVSEWAQFIALHARDLLADLAQHGETADAREQEVLIEKCADHVDKMASLLRGMRKSARLENDIELLEEGKRP